ncbi:MAG: putative toxin-antitoxin system toxin component, PIN family [Candidatus Magnetobacterium sp. LHC-1]|uniref:Toxin-antitoxin system toxin component, PIN family n=1 Tax=Candidatus Magnetobacterium casense TaxID=1455061 RepID=A0ABS6RXK2_9BACT|nr:putative toxin-antitoxin system toxin component, PIN family [Candidatus Magnetobacterium casensis]MBF0607056.1 putative toxin-antitoxin system toxin component, PIN family [Nitrospirota bacterium]MBV6341346.1 putative toxin-antitoxin system toxin component, PIN family [Candidatus Magnetobacterium casensis]
MLKVLLDANIFVSALIKPYSNPSMILNMVREGRVRLLLSGTIIYEVRRVLSYARIRRIHRFTDEQIDEFVKDLSEFAIITPGNIKVDVIKDDPADNKYIECAIEGQADYIVSGDRHLTNLKHFQGINIVDPAMFIRLLKDATGSC